ncbi:hypothetical protein AYI70_g8493 [Smittium culicis]|uniref:Uncharacterized protein n=1 Tax=Smittium culicis TaxID=133412 RepID=A0A1R1XFM4_9FUNG|nr:hypothetical protein AYI70_g8493 [Smittium culicis]
MEPDYSGSMKNPLDISSQNEGGNIINDFSGSEGLLNEEISSIGMVYNGNKKLDVSDNKEEHLINDFESLLNESQNDNKDYSKNTALEKASATQNSILNIIQTTVENIRGESYYYSTINYTVEKTVHVDEYEPKTTTNNKIQNIESKSSILNEPVPNSTNTELAASAVQGKTLYLTLNKTKANDSGSNSMLQSDGSKNILVRDVPTKTDSHNLKVAEVGAVPKNKEVITVTKSLKNGQRTIFLIIKKDPINKQRAINNIYQPNIPNENGRYIRNYSNNPSVGYAENIQLGENSYISPIFRNNFRHKKNCGYRGKKCRHNRKSCGCRNNNIRYNINPNLIELGQTNRNMCRKIFCVRNRCGKLVCRAYFVPCKIVSTTITRSQTSTSRSLPPLTPI